MGSYTYDPANIAAMEKDRMRFELGDTMAAGGADTCALTDEEITTVIELYPGKWKKAKLFLLESICRRFAYEPDTKSGPVSFSFGERAKLWREDYEKLKQEVSKASVSVPSYGLGTNGQGKPPYFYTGMMGNREVEG